MPVANTVDQHIIGGNELDALYLGDTLIWSSTAPPTYPAYVQTCIDLGAVSVFDGLTCQITGDTLPTGPEEPGPDGLTFIPNITETAFPLSASAGLPADGPLTLVGLARCDTSLMSTGTAQHFLGLRSGGSTRLELGTRRDSAYDFWSTSRYDPYAPNLEVTPLANGDRFYGLFACSIQPGANPANTDIAIRTFGAGATDPLVQVSGNRGSNTRPNGTALVLDRIGDQPGVEAVGGFALFPSYISDQDFADLRAAVPSLETLIT